VIFDHRPAQPDDLFAHLPADGDKSAATSVRRDWISDCNSTFTASTFPSTRAISARMLRKSSRTRLSGAGLKFSTFVAEHKMRFLATAVE
jgi:hypothetical protein